MNLANLISEEYCYAMVWTLIHSLWQAGVIYLLLYLLFEFSFFKTAARKYWTAYLALPILILTSVITFQHLHESAQVNIPHHYQVPINIINADSDFTKSNPLPVQTDFLEEFTVLVNNHSSELLWFWLIGLFFVSLRIVFGLSYLEKLRFNSTAISDSKWQLKVDAMLQKMGCHRMVEIAESSLIDAPQLLGHFKPIILFPIGLINQLKIEEVESILIHELSHVVRQDFLFNIFQTILENVYFFNPFVHLISRTIRKEREFACDDQSMGLIENDLHYARALFRIGEEAKNKSFALGFGGSKNYLLQRVERIFNQTKHTKHYMEKIMTSTLLLALIVILSMAASVGESPAKLEVNEMYPEKIIPMSIETIGLQSMEEQKPFISIDTFPNKSKSTCEMKWFEDGSRVDVSYEDDEISSLRINGVEIEKAEYPKYADMLELQRLKMDDVQVIKIDNKHLKNNTSMLYPSLLTQITDSIDLDGIMERVENLMEKHEEELGQTWDDIEEKVWRIQIDSQDISDAMKEAEFQISVWENNFGEKKIYIDSLLKNHPIFQEFKDFKLEDLDSMSQKIDLQEIKEKFDWEIRRIDEEVEKAYEKIDDARVFHFKEWDFTPGELPNGIKLDSIMIHLNDRSNNMEESIDSVMRVYRLNLEDFMDENDFNFDDAPSTRKEKAERWKEYKRHMKEEKAKKKRELKSY